VCMRERVSVFVRYRKEDRESCTLTILYEGKKYRRPERTERKCKERLKKHFFFKESESIYIFCV